MGRNLQISLSLQFGLLLSMCLLVSSAAAEETLKALPPATFQTLPEMMADMKYPLETHFITTSDGYILQYFRIQKKNQESILSGLPVVFYQHGLMDSSDLACLNDEFRAPALILANQGYDVWLGNSRGNRYSKNHTTLSLKSSAYWNFSFQEMGKYDLPAAFTYISKITGQKINYIGHSQGTTQMFVALSRNDKAVEDNLKSYIALGPATFVGNVRSIFMKLLSHARPVIASLVVLKIKQFMPYKDSILMPLLCQSIPELCGMSLQMMMDLDTKYDNLLKMDVISGHLPAGTSTFNVRHWGQNMRSGNFKYFNYGTFKNYLEYNQATPPKIALEKIRVPVHLFAGATDALADLKDVGILRRLLTGSPNVTYNEYPFGHASFLIALDMSYMNDVLSILEDYNPTMKKDKQEKLKFTTDL